MVFSMERADSIFQKALPTKKREAVPQGMERDAFEMKRYVFQFKCSHSNRESCFPSLVWLPYLSKEWPALNTPSIFPPCFPLGPTS